MTIIHITLNRIKLEETLSEMMDVPVWQALSLEVLMMAMMRLPLQTRLAYDKIFGRWIFSNQDEEDWPKEVRQGQRVSGPNFTFIADHPAMAIAQGVYYYYHTKIKE